MQTQHAPHWSQMTNERLDCLPSISLARGRGEIRNAFHIRNANFSVRSNWIALLKERDELDDTSGHQDDICRIRENVLFIELERDRLALGFQRILGLVASISLAVAL